MNLQERIRDWSQPIYFLGQNPVTLTGAVITTSTALTTIAFWFYDVFLPGPPHPLYRHSRLSNPSGDFRPRSGADSTWYLAQAVLAPGSTCSADLCSFSFRSRLRTLASYIFLRSQGCGNRAPWTARETARPLSPSFVSCHQVLYSGSQLCSQVFDI